MTKLKFEELNLSNEILKAVKDMGFEEASPIQTEAIPVAMSGKDMIGQAQTGTGKTAAYGIPILEKIDIHSDKLQAVILCPTRELTIQVAEEMNKLAKYTKTVIVPIYGGQSIERQFTSLRKKHHIIIGTPGRVIDHLNRKTLSMDHVQTFVLDEADEMLNMGFVEDIELILEHVPQERQSLFFSATLPPRILDLTKKYQRDPQLVKVVHKELTVANIEQCYFEVAKKNKLEVLCRLIDIHNVKLGIIFCNTKMGVEEVLEQLQARGYSVEALHGDMKQMQREQVMKKFRKGVVELLVATDVAARGIDVDDVEVVFNYDIPYDEEYYVHRIGRTGRAGKSGKSFTFVVGKEIYKLKDIERYAKTKIPYEKVPSLNEVEEFKVKIFLNNVKDVIKNQNLEPYRAYAEQLISEDFTALDISLALMKMNLELENKKAGEVEDVISFDTDRQVSGKMARLFINVGHKDKVGPGDILGAISGETGVPGKKIGGIDIYERFAFVEIPIEYVDTVITGMKEQKIKGRDVSLEIANDKPTERRPRSGGSGRGGGSSSDRERPRTSRSSSEGRSREGFSSRDNDGSRRIRRR